MPNTLKNYKCFVTENPHAACNIILRATCRAACTEAIFEEVVNINAFALRENELMLVGVHLYKMLKLMQIK